MKFSYQMIKFDINLKIYIGTMGYLMQIYMYISIKNVFKQPIIHYINKPEYLIESSLTFIIYLRLKS